MNMLTQFHEDNLQKERL